MEFIKIAYLCLIHVICVITDYREKKIKNCWVAAVFIGALIFKIWDWNGQFFLKSWWMMGLFFIVLFPLYVIRAIGAGDVKLLCVTAFYIGEEIEVFLIGALVSAGVLALVKLLYYKNLRKRMWYFFDYMRKVMITGEIDVYGIPKKEEEFMRLAIPIFIGMLCWGFCFVAQSCCGH